jgi:hypothetical protein
MLRVEGSWLRAGKEGGEGRIKNAKCKIEKADGEGEQLGRKKIPISGICEFGGSKCEFSWSRLSRLSRLVPRCPTIDFFWEYAGRSNAEFAVRSADREKAARDTNYTNFHEREA